MKNIIQFILSRLSAAFLSRVLSLFLLFVDLLNAFGYTIMFCYENDNADDEAKAQGGERTEHW